MKIQKGHTAHFVQQDLEKANCASSLGAQTQSPWDRARAQGPLPPTQGRRSSACCVKHQGLCRLSAPSTFTKSSHSCRLVGENLQHNRSCPTMILILAVQNKISDRRFLWSTICFTIRRPPCTKFSHVWFATACSCSSVTLVQAHKNSIVQRLQC